MTGRRIIILLLGLLMLSCPQVAHAYDFYQPVTIDPVTNTVCPGQGFTRRLVPCVKETIVYTVNSMLVPLSVYFANTVTLVCLLAIILWGFAVASGRNSAPWRDALMLGTKIGIVLLFTANFGGMFGMLLDALDDMLGLLAGYATYSSSLSCPANADPAVLKIWFTVDCAFETLIGGIFSPYTLSAGIAGFLVACLLSGAIGFFIAMIGFYLILELLFAIVRAVYIFVSAYMGFALLVLISPMIIPLILSETQKGIVEKWIRLIGNYIKQALMLVVYLVMLLAAYDTVVYTGPNSLYHAIAGPVADNPCFEVPTSVACPGGINGVGSGGLGGWLMGPSPGDTLPECGVLPHNGAYCAGEIGARGINIDPGAARATLGVPQDVDTGVLGVIGEQLGATANDWKTDIFNFLGVGKDKDLRFFKVGAAVTNVDFVWLADATGFPDITSYVVNLFLSFLMALITGYIFLTILDFLPFISSSGGSSTGMQILGMGKLAPPGEGFMKKLGGFMGKG